MTRIPFDRSNAHEFARALIGYASEAASGADTATFSLPALTLAVASDSAGYLGLCRRALVDDRRLSAAGQRLLSVGVFDYATHPDMPRGIWSDAELSLNVLAQGLESSGIEGAFDLDNQLWQFLDPAAGQGVEALAVAGGFPPWVASFPLRNFFHWAYQAIGWRIVHAGSLAAGGRGVLLIGAGGAGKSGTTLSGILAGLGSAGDDYLAIERTADGFRAHPVMKLMKQDARGLARLGLEPRGLGLGPVNWQNKHEFDFEMLGRGRRADTIDLDAILAPRIARARRSSFSRAPAQVAMMGLAPSNLQQLPGGWRAGLGFTAAMVRRLPAFYLDLSEDPGEIGDALGEFIAGRRP